MGLLREELIEAATGQKRPPKSSIAKLVKAFALKKYSVSDSAPMKAQKDFDKKFFALYSKMQDKYPYIDMDSSPFWNSLESQADAWWNKQVMRGAGKNW